MHDSITNSLHKLNDPQRPRFPRLELLFVYCPNCSLFWFKNYVPEYCPECGVFVTKTPGTGQAEDVITIQKKGLNLPASECAFCGLQVLGTPAEWKKRGCPRCYNKQLVLITNYKPPLRERITDFIRSLI